MSKKRRDAVMIDKVDGLHTILPYVMPHRTDAEVAMQETFDITYLNKYMAKRNEAEGINLKLFHAICTAVAKTIYWRPKLNIFIRGRKYWQRNDITLSFIVKRTFEDSSEESLMFLTVKPDMTFTSISKEIIGDVSKLRKESGKNDIGDMIDIFAKIPRPILTFAFWIFKRLEYHGRMPKALTDGDTDYSTVILSNLGSIKCGACYHHLNNYGTNSIVATIGTAHKAVEYDADNVPVLKDVVDIHVCIDERIADGFYFARSIKLIKYFLEHPEELDEPIGNELSEGAKASL